MVKRGLRSIQITINLCKFRCFAPKHHNLIFQYEGAHNSRRSTSKMHRKILRNLVVAPNLIPIKRRRVYNGLHTVPMAPQKKTAWNTHPFRGCASYQLGTGGGPNDLNIFTLLPPESNNLEFGVSPTRFVSQFLRLSKLDISNQTTNFWDRPSIYSGTHLFVQWTSTMLTMLMDFLTPTYPWTFKTNIQQSCSPADGQLTWHGRPAAAPRDFRRWNLTRHLPGCNSRILHLFVLESQRLTGNQPCSNKSTRVFRCYLGIFRCYVCIFFLLFGGA